jgi:hypothetical protein
MVELTLRTAIVVILSAVILLLLFPFATKVYAGVPKAFSEAECRASVQLRARTAIGLLDVESPLPFECSTRTIFVKYDETGRKKDELLDSVTPTYYVTRNNKEKLKKIFAESLGNCLWMMGDGNLGAFGGTAGATGCVICYDIIIDSDIIDPGKGNIQVLDYFPNYLESNKFSKTKDYYSSYFNTAEMPSPKLEQDGKPLSQTIFFSYRKMSRREAAEFAAKTTGAAGAIGGCLTGAIFGFLAGGPVGAAGGCLAGAVAASTVTAAGTAAGAVVGYAVGGDGIFMLGFVPVHEMGGKCQGLF